MLNFLYTLIIYPIVQIIECVFVFAQKVFKETGISIMCVSGAISVLCLPLYMVAESWQEVERNIQKRLKPGIDKIKAVFKGDEQYMILSTYYRQNRYHPVMAMRSTFGLLIQIPFFIAAYSYLSHLDALKGASFLFLRDLGKPDALLAIGGGTSVNILPILMTFVNIVSGAVYTKDFSLKDRIQLYGMALVFLVLLYNSPAGLVLYWTLNNVFSLAKNTYLAIRFPGKNKVVFVFLSILCAMMIGYIMLVLRRDIQIKIVMSALFLILALILWSLPLAKKLTAKLQRIRYSPRNLFSVFLISFLGTGMVTGVFLPVMLIASSPQEFSYIDSYTNPLFFAANAALQNAGFFVFYPVCLYFLFSGTIKKALALAGIVFYGTVLCNVFLFPGSYGLVSIELIFDNGVGHNVQEILKNLGVLLIVSGVLAFLFFKNRYNIILPVLLLSCVSVFGVSVVNIAAIQKEFRKLQSFHKNNENEITAVEPIIRLSKTGKNTIVIMLDRATSAFVPYILDESPELAGIYSGFVYYPNTVSFNGYTRLGAPPLFGGYEYAPSALNKRDTVSMRDKHNEALLLLPRIFSEAGFAAAITDPPYPNYSYKEDLRIYDSYGIKAYITDGTYTQYWLKEHGIKLPSQSDVLKHNIFWYGILKITPLAVRSGIYQHGGWFAPFSAHKFISNLNAYSALDYLPRLTEFENEKENTFFFMVNNTTHEAQFFQAPEYRPALTITNYGSSLYSKENEYHANVAALKRLGDFFNFLKTEKAYDNTRIILVSDHGAQVNYVLKTSLPFNLDNVNPLLMFKDFNAEGALKTDMTFMSNADVPFLALHNQGILEKNPFTGNAITTEDKEHPLYIALSGGVHLEDPDATIVSLDDTNNFYVHDNIFDEKNWTRASK